MTGKSIKQSLAEIAEKYGVIGRESEMEALLHCVSANKHVLLEGPVGVGKTFLISAVAQYLDREIGRAHV